MLNAFSKVKGLNELLLLYIIINKITYINTSTTCEPGYYITKKGCAPCSAGTYSFQEDATSCYKSKQGTYSLTGSSTCVLCQKESYTNKEGSSVCLPCPASTYVNVMGSSSCIAGKFSKSGSTGRNIF